MGQTGAMSLTGADLLVQTAVLNGVDHCFANPGTTELHLVQALDRAENMRNVLCAFEGVCSGAADGFARMAGRPALGLFHLGPGYANALANLHNARRHHTPMINLIGDQASWHLEADAPLTSDVDLLTGWTGATLRSGGASDTGRIMAEAVKAAVDGPQRIANIVIPADHAWGETDRSPGAALPQAADTGPNPKAVSEAAAALREAAQSKEGAALMLGGPLISAGSLRLADGIRAATGCEIFTTRAARLEMGQHLPIVSELPYFPQPLFAALADVRHAVMAGAEEPVTFFGYPDTPSHPLPAAAQRYVLSDQNQSLELALEALGAELGVLEGGSTERPAGDLSQLDRGPLDPRNLGQAFARGIPEGAVVVSESITSGGGYRALAAHAAPHTLLSVTGGAIGGGLPAAVGAAVACPDRQVLSLQADGSALYTIQALWTMARESLDITVVICANRRYQILDIELQAAGIELSDTGSSLTDLSGPHVDFTQVAAGFGVPAVSVQSGEELEAALARAAVEPGPNLIEAVMVPAIQPSPGFGKIA